MYQRKQDRSGACHLPAVVGIAALAASLASPQLAAAATPAECSVGALESLDIAGMDYTSVTDVVASGSTPEYCDVIGTLNTTGEGADPGSAGFEIRLPVTWNGKFLFFGVGGLAGSTYADVATNPVDLAQALSKGYATAITDTGHQAGGTDAAWALLRPGVPDTPKLIDYYYRATHEVTVAGKQLVQAYYKAQIKDAYFDGCSNGGRQAMIEAADFPEDYDGIISGAPFFDIRVVIQGTKTSKALLQSAQGFIPATLLPQVDAAIYAACDAADGVMDGLIQNPGACNIDPHKLSVAGLTKDMTDTLAAYWSRTTDQNGGFVYNGFSVSDLDTGTGFDLWGTGFMDPPPNGFGVAEPWGNDGFSPAPIGFQFQDHILKYLVARDPNFNLLSFPVSTEGVLKDQALQLFDERTGPGSAPAPEDYQAFIHQGRKLLIWQGYSDPALIRSGPFASTSNSNSMPVRITRCRAMRASSWLRECSIAAAAPARTRSAR